VHIVAEAESGTLVKPMTKHSDPTASNGNYVETSTANSGSVSITVNIPQDGTYVVWGRVYAATDTSDSFFVSVEGGSKDIYDVAEGRWAAAWQWTVVNGRGSGGPASISPRLFYLTAGNHTFKFDGREAGTRLDQILITNDLQYVPQ